MTFDIFGTVVDWQKGLESSLGSRGYPLREGDFDRIVDIQGILESAAFRPYREIVALSLGQALGLRPEQADILARDIGAWPLFPDARQGLERLMAVAPCIAMTNSDRIHGEQVQRQLSFKLSDWICAEDLRLYKPAAEFWRTTAQRSGFPMNRDWWHVSAYADYDLGIAGELGLTCVFIPRRHRRPGPAHYTVPDLNALADLIASAAGGVDARR